MLNARHENPPPIVTLTVAELEADPHGVLRRHRAITPFVAHERGGYMVLRAADVEQLIKDPRTRQIETEYAKLRGFTEGALYENFEFSMLFSNDPAHRRRRSPFTRTFAAKMILEMRPHIRAIAEGLVDEWHGEGEVDLVERYAALIPARVASRLLGLPQADIPHFTGLVYSVCRILSLNFAPQDIPEMERAALRRREFHDFAGFLPRLAQVGIVVAESVVLKHRLPVNGERSEQQDVKADARANHQRDISCWAGCV